MRRQAPPRSPKRLVLAALGMALFTAAGPGLAAPDWDIVGLKLGMTEAEVRAAFQAYDARARSSRRSRPFPTATRSTASGRRPS